MKRSLVVVIFGLLLPLSAGAARKPTAMESVSITSFVHQIVSRWVPPSCDLRLRITVSSVNGSYARAIPLWWLNGPCAQYGANGGDFFVKRTDGNWTLRPSDPLLRCGETRSHIPYAVMDDLLDCLTSKAASRVFDAYFHRAGSFIPKPARAPSCPKVEFNPGPGLPDGYACTIEYRFAGKWNLVEGGVARRGGVIQPVNGTYHRTWVRKWKASSSACRRSASLHGYLSSNDGRCDAQMAGDIEDDLRLHEPVRWIGYHGTNWAGFEAIASFPCRHLGRSYRCQNRLGDAFIYTAPA